MGFFRSLVRSSCDLNARLRRVPQIEATELLAETKGTADAPSGRAIVVDVRPLAERFVSIIPGAIAAETFEPTRHLAPGDRVVAYCTAGFRSANYAARLRRHGIDAVNLRGGLYAWCDGDGPLVDDRNEPTRRVHIYRKGLSLLADGYEPVW